MAKGLYGSINGATKKVKKNYAVIGGKTRKIKRMYAVVNGVTRRIFSDCELSYHGTIQGLSAARYYLAAVSIGDYALFAGGNYYASSSTVNYDTVDTYNKSLSKGIATSLSGKVSKPFSTTIGNYALIACSSFVDTYNKSLTKGSAAALSSTHSWRSATTVGNYALIVGGDCLYDDTGNPIYDALPEAYNASLTKTTLSSIATGYINNNSSTTVGEYAIFAGFGRMGSGTKMVISYDSSLTYHSVDELTNYKTNMSAATVGNRAIFAGGTTSGNCYSTVDTYNTSLTKGTANNLTHGKFDMASTTLDTYALFSGGFAHVEDNMFGSGATNVVYDTVEVYNESLVSSITTSLCVGRDRMEATTINDYAIIAGGRPNQNNIPTGTVDVYKVT